MDSSNSALIIAILSFVTGALVGGALIAWLLPSRKKNRDLEKHLNEKQDELKNFQQDVTEHFTKTAELVSQLAHSYRDVHNHLASGAQTLCKDAFTNDPILTKLPPLENLQDEDDQRPARPPLDYAPKSSPYDRGTLNEEYGLEKIPSEDDDADSVSPTPQAVLKSK